MAIDLNDFMPTNGDINAGVDKAIRSIRKMKVIDIELYKLKPSADNFYQLTNIEELKDNIREFGLIEPIVAMETDGNEYEIISGHRRYEAFTQLAKESTDYSRISCRVIANMSELKKKILLVSANKEQRAKTDWEKTVEINKMISYLEAYKKDTGVKMSPRAKLEEMTGRSRSDIGRHITIYNNLSAEMMERYKNGDLTYSNAVFVARYNARIQNDIAAKIEGEITKDKIEQIILDTHPVKQETVQSKLLKEEETPNEINEIELEKQGQQQLPDVDRQAEGAAEVGWFDQYGRHEWNDHLQTYRLGDLEKIYIKDERLRQGGFVIYIIQDKEDLHWRSSFGVGFIEVGAGRWPRRDSRNPVNSKEYPSFYKKEDAIKHAKIGLNFCVCQEEREVLEELGWGLDTTAPASHEAEPVEEDESENDDCGEDDYEEYEEDEETNQMKDFIKWEIRALERGIELRKNTPKGRFNTTAEIEYLKRTINWHKENLKNLAAKKEQANGNI